ncbi:MULTISPECIES: hypothetical protein [Streptomyces]|uniref:Uncharacterized protein n=1 Tax=Streptomyces cuspidosporus TaxID=66882 RepID=A0ABP5TQR4_9ACTN
MTTPRQTQNRAKFWNARISEAKTDQERATVWQNACRTVAAQAEKDGRPEVWAELVKHLHAFYRHHAG